MTQLYTASRIRAVRTCLRLHHYRYHLGIRTAETDVMRFGTRAHAALEAWLRAWQAGADRLAAALVVIDAIGDLYERARMRALIVAYDARWGAEEWEVLAVEVEFRYELGDNLIGGKCDGIIRNRRDGRVYVLEHKTTGMDASVGTTYWERLTLDVQVSIYVDGATVLGYEIAGVIYDVLQRPQHERKLATPPEVRKYTLGKGCKACGGSAGGKRGVVRGSGRIALSFATLHRRQEHDGDGPCAGCEPAPGAPSDVACAACNGTGWKLDDQDVPEAPRLHANQRDVDEPVEEFEARIVDSITANPDAFLIRGEVVRLVDELPGLRVDLLDWIKVAEAAKLFDLHPRNDDACAKYGFNSLCSFFGACTGREDIHDLARFPRGGAHPELAAPT